MLSYASQRLRHYLMPNPNSLLRSDNFKDRGSSWQANIRYRTCWKDIKSARLGGCTDGINAPCRSPR